MAVRDPLEDAVAWFLRARHHVDQYRRMSTDREQPVFRIVSGRETDGQFVYSLVVDRGLTTAMKPVAAEAANALFQALDHIVATGCRLSGVVRHRSISWPFGVRRAADYQSQAIEGLIPRVEPHVDEEMRKLAKRGLPEPWLNVITATFEEHRLHLGQIDVIKEVSLSGKHWQLIPTTSGVLGITWNNPGEIGQHIREVPTGHFSECDAFDFHRGEAIRAEHFQYVVGVYFVAERTNARVEPLTALGATVAFVGTALMTAPATASPELVAAWVRRSPAATPSGRKCGRWRLSDAT